MLSVQAETETPTCLPCASLAQTIGRRISIEWVRSLLQGSPHSAEEVAWALSIIHSRSFLFNGIHVFVPGIDFCNHTASSPTATVRCAHPLSQGAEAEAEVCEPQPLEPSRFELVAGEGGIR